MVERGEHVDETCGQDITEIMETPREAPRLGNRVGDCRSMSVISLVLMQMLKASTELGLIKCVLPASGEEMWPRVCFVYSDVISREWSQCQVEHSCPAGLVHMTYRCLRRRSNPLVF